PRRDAIRGGASSKGLLSFKDINVRRSTLVPRRQRLDCGMGTPRGGTFALRPASHACLEFDALEGVARNLVRTIATLREPRTTMGGVNLVAGFRPGVWGGLAPEDAPA